MQRILHAVGLAALISSCGELPRELDETRQLPSENVFYPDCGNVRVKKITAISSGNLHYLQASVTNEESFTRGFVLSYHDSDTMDTALFKQLATEPSLIASGSTGTFLVAISNKPFPTSQAYLALSVHFLGCPALSAMDILVQGWAGYTYTIQRSPNLQDWENLETFRLNDDRVIWRSSEWMLRSSPPPVREFYRVSTIAPPGVDDSKDGERLRKSSLELRKIYR
ncbi:MAG TPA: hypothetical protein VM901_07845 [Bdellovibrionota bacterium]|jgi:hypothetical protein|nr:hypothetical protein [Bdellovibrionota bacterium]